MNLLVKFNESQMMREKSVERKFFSQKEFFCLYVKVREILFVAKPIVFFPPSLHTPFIAVRRSVSQSAMTGNYCITASAHTYAI